LNWNDQAKKSQFRLGLKEDVRRVLVGKKMPEGFEDFVSEVILIDNDLRAFEMEKKSTRAVSSSSPQPAQTSLPTTTAPTSTGTHSGPMDLGAGHRGKLSQEEKDRRRANNLCLFCGKSGHYASLCPVKSSDKRRIALAHTEESSTTESSAGHSAAVLYSSAPSEN
jgi:hypothetical protein